jgi:phage shock protein A
MQWLTTLGVAVATAVFLGSVVVYLRGARDQGTIATLERYGKACEARVTQLEDEAARTLVEHDRLEARFDALEHENEALRAERPSAQAIAELTDLLRRHDADAKAMLSALMLKGIKDE